VADYIKDLSIKHDLAVVGGSDLTKIHKQLGESTYQLIKPFTASSMYAPRMDL